MMRNFLPVWEYLSTPTSHHFPRTKATGLRAIAIDKQERIRQIGLRHAPQLSIGFVAQASFPAKYPKVPRIYSLLNTQWRWPYKCR